MRAVAWRRHALPEPPATRPPARSSRAPRRADRSSGVGDRGGHAPGITSSDDGDGVQAPSQRVGPTGFEPVTRRLRVCRSNRAELRARKKYSQPARSALTRKGGRGDSNPQPPGPQPGALTELSYGHHAQPILAVAIGAPAVPWAVVQLP